MRSVIRSRRSERAKRHRALRQGLCRATFSIANEGGWRSSKPKMLSDSEQAASTSQPRAPQSPESRTCCYFQSSVEGGSETLARLLAAHH